MSRVAGLVLAGGKSSRMGGGDKSLLEIESKTILSLVLSTVRPEVAALAISANGDPARFGAFGLPVLADESGFVGGGPLAGVLAGLDWAAADGADWLLTIPGDTPFLPPGLVAALAPPPAFAACAGQDHFLIALWPVACRGALRAMFRTSPRRAVAIFGEQIGARRVCFPPANRDAFMNVNTPLDLEKARSMMARKR